MRPIISLLPTSRLILVRARTRPKYFSMLTIRSSGGWAGLFVTIGPPYTGPGSQPDISEVNGDTLLPDRPQTIILTYYFLSGGGSKTRIDETLYDACHFLI